MRPPCSSWAPTTTLLCPFSRWAMDQCRRLIRVKWNCNRRHPQMHRPRQRWQIHSRRRMKSHNFHRIILWVDRSIYARFVVIVRVESITVCTVVRAARDSSSEQCVKSFRTRAERRRIALSTKSSATDVNIVDIRNAWTWEWNGKRCKRSDSVDRKIQRWAN